MSRDGQQNLSESEYAEYLAQKAAQIVEQRLGQRESRWRAIIGVVITILAIFGYTNLSSMREDIKTLVTADLKVVIESSIEDVFDKNKDKIADSKIAALHVQLEEQIAFTQFVQLTLELKNRESNFSNAERDAAVDLLRKITNNKEILSTSTFLVALENLIDVFNNAYLKHYIDEVEGIIRPYATSSPGITQTLVVHYGIRTLGGVEISAATRESFQRYIIAAEKNKYPEFALPFRMLRIFQEKGVNADSKINALWSDYDQLDDDEKSVFHSLIETFIRFKDSNDLADASRLGELAELYRFEYPSKFPTQVILNQDEVLDSLRNQNRD